MPRIPDLEDLYRIGVKFRQGQIMMIAGRSGTQKSGLALWLAEQWRLPTLYISADMSAFTASSRLASTITGDTTEQVEVAMLSGGAQRKKYMDALAPLRMIERDGKAIGNFKFAFGSPITWRGFEEEIEAYVAMWDAYPELVVFDNLMDFEGAQSDYTAQMDVMQGVTEFSRHTGASCIVLHHASDKNWEAKTDPWAPPSRDQIKGGLSEKPELSLSVALDPYSLEYKIACVKQRMGPQDPTARRYATLRCYPEVTRFAKRTRENGALA